MRFYCQDAEFQRLQDDYAVSGKEGMAILTSALPDLVLLDLGLPDMDGIDVIKQTREWSSLPIIVISARVQEKEKVAALDAGADDYITKPFGTDELLARIRTAIRHSNKIMDDRVNSNRPYSAKGLSIDFCTQACYRRRQRSASHQGGI